jgi:hypothetical protein
MPYILVVEGQPVNKNCTLVVSGFRMSAYEEIRNRLSKKDKNGFSLWKKVIAGMMAGGNNI